MPLRLRRPSANRNSSYLKFLKPGALAQLRDSKISARCNRFGSQSQICLYRSPSTSGQLPAGELDGLPCFAGRIYGPRCPQRKKLAATKCMFFLSSNPSSPVPDLSESNIDVFGSDILLAH
ncbi:hypothetical protein LguiA_022713 [Lonicera macranthoides]